MTAGSSASVQSAPASYVPEGDRADLARVTDAALAFAREYDRWLRQFAAERLPGKHARLGLQPLVEELGRLAIAVRQPPSVGIYGESQCGKSNLVSRIGSGLGARSTPEGSLLIRDPSADPAAESSAPPWKQSEERAIEFARWLNPVNNNEATGIICRFTSGGPEPVRAGCFVARLLSNADLVVSLALGSHLMTMPRPSEESALETVERLRSGATEEDAEGMCGHLLAAAAVLRDAWGGDERPNPWLAELDASGWFDFVRNCFDRGVRPRWNRNDHGSPFIRLVGVLWRNQRHLCEVYSLLLGALHELGHVCEVSLPAESVCRSGETAVATSSLLNVNHLDGLFQTSHGAPGVRVDFRTDAGTLRSHRLPRATLSGLLRELVLPVEPDGVSRSEGVDVLDFPGARAAAQQYDFGTHGEPHRAALDVFRRGKLNWLFAAGVHLQDSTALCLAVQGAGNLEAGPVVTEALAVWLAREGWPPADGARISPPPMVVAITKSDMLLKTGNDRVFGDRLREIHRRYGGEGGERSWMRNWVDGPFTNVHWVHNPKARGNAPLPDKADPELARDRDAYLSDEDVCRHLPARAEELFNALLEQKDVDKLFDALREVVLEVPRDRRLLSLVLNHSSQLASETARLYLGPDQTKRVEEEVAAAIADVKYLLEGCERGRNSLATFLKCLRIQAIDVHRACREAFKQVGGRDREEVGVARFDAVFQQLYLAFCDRIDRGVAELEVERDRFKVRLDSLRSHFAQLPNEPWFRERIHSPQVEKRFLGRNPAQLERDPVLAAFVTTAWNRSTVWLDEEPSVPAMPAVPPKRRAHFAASQEILAHWEQRLPEVYRKMVDPKRASLGGNPELAAIRGKFSQALKEVRASTEPRHPALKAAFEQQDGRIAELLEFLES